MRIHFISFGSALLNSLSKNTIGYGVVQQIELPIELLSLASGLFLFFFYYKPFRPLGLYLSLYPIGTLILTLAILFRGIFGAIIWSIMLYPIWPEEPQYQYDSITISDTYQGAFAKCCHYRLKENKWVIFEKTLGTMEIESNGSLNDESLQLILSEDSVEWHFKNDFVNQTGIFSR